jgi:hypothetical protein
MYDFKLSDTPTGAYFVLYALTDAAHEWIKRCQQPLATDDAISEFLPVPSIPTIVDSYILPVRPQEKDDVLEAIQKAGLSVDTASDLTGVSERLVASAAASGEKPPEHLFIGWITKEGILRGFTDGADPNKIEESEEAVRRAKPDADTEFDLQCTNCGATTCARYKDALLSCPKCGCTELHVAATHPPMKPTGVDGFREVEGITTCSRS